MADANYYEILGVTPGATPEEIRAAYLELVKRVHPDSGGNEALFRSVNAAYETLSDPGRRARYDRNGFLDADAPPTDAAAPGWRRTDGPTGGNGASATSEPGTRSDSATGGASGGPAPGPPPSAPPASDTGEGQHGTGPSWSHIASGTILRMASANPSIATFGAGVALVVFGTHLGSAAPSSLLVGFALAVVGLLGIAGRDAAARRETNERASIGNLGDASDAEFEQRLVSAFRHVGYTVYQRRGREDDDVDLVLDLPGSRTVVQARRWYAAVDPAVIKETIASRSHYDAQHAIVVSTSGFTKTAVDVATANHVETWNANRLSEFIAAQELGPTRTGTSLLGRELRYGTPVVLRRSLAFLAGMAATGASTKKRRRKR